MSVPIYDGASAAASVLMSHTRRSRPFLFVEGICEVLLISHHYPDYSDQIVHCSGHTGVKEAIKVIEEWETSHNTKLLAMGFIDRDYSSHSHHSNYKRIAVTANRDVEVDIYLTPAGERLLREKATQSKCPDPRNTLSEAMHELCIVGLIRKYNSENACSWDINAINLEKCLNDDGSFNEDKYLLRFMQKNNISKTKKKSYITFFSRLQESRLS